MRNNISQFSCAKPGPALSSKYSYGSFFSITPEIHIRGIMAGKVKLDSVDRQILGDLQDDGRMTNVDLAKRAGISAPPCLRRAPACSPTPE